jgi:hypothetical protein
MAKEYCFPGTSTIGKPFGRLVGSGDIFYEDTGKPCNNESSLATSSAVFFADKWTRIASSPLPSLTPLGDQSVFLPPAPIVHSSPFVSIPMPRPPILINTSDSFYSCFYVQ